ncbi:MAG: hypothetical protein CXZ00_14500 [Acidobacteria bacterium]|nr:MAG: hypothetical protein CXZ00_14500 [Acidobacteriota bacterium]
MKKHILLLGFALVAARAARAQSAIGEVFSSDAGVRGSVILSGNGTRVLSGSQVSAGDGIALLKLERGGEVRICPKTSLSFSADPSGKALVLGLNTGSMELNYSLRAASDSLVTPDFRLQLISPGKFHFAISVLPSGDTCLRSLPGNNAAIFITEMMGSESYQLSPGKDVMFRTGKISGITDAPPICGCPEVKREMLRANVPPPMSPPMPPPAKEFFPPAKPAGEPHLEVDSSFVYRGNGVAEDYYVTVARLAVSRDNSRLALALLPRVSGPAQASDPPKKKQGMLDRIGGFLGRLFRK